MLPEISLDGVRVHRITEREAIAHVIESWRAGRGGRVITPNTDQLRQCRRSAGARELVSRADLAVADGMPLVWASRLQGTPLPERVAGSNLIWTLTGAAAEAGASVFLLGGEEGVAGRAAQALTERYPALRIAGTMRPEFGFESDPAALAEIEAAVTAARPDIVYVGLGFPKQDHLITRLAPLLPSAWFLGVGISLSFVSGDVARAPRWMRAAGLEWAHRLAIEPGRLFRRYVVEGLPFAAGLLARSAMTGARRRRDPSAV